MAISPTEPATDRHTDGQGTMFDSTLDSVAAAEFPGHDLTELPGEPEDYGEPETSETFEPFDDSFEDEGPEISYGATAASPVYPNPDPYPGPDPAPEPSPTPDPEPHPDSPNLPLTIADFAALEDRVLRAVSLVRRERHARASAEERAGFQEGRAAAAEARAVALDQELKQLQQQAPVIETLQHEMEQLQQEVDSLRQEREQVRQRVERLLGQLDALEL